VARAAGSIDLKRALAPQIECFAWTVCNAVADKSTRVILNKLPGSKAAPDDRILQAVATGATRMGLLDITQTLGLAASVTHAKH